MNKPMTNTEIVAKRRFAAFDYGPGCVLVWVLSVFICAQPWLSLGKAAAPPAPQAVLRVDAGKVLNHVTPLMYGACIEDVNHEIYGGLYAQMIFGESFEEPPHPRPTGIPPGISGMWDAVRTGAAQARWTWASDRPFNGCAFAKDRAAVGRGNDRRGRSWPEPLGLDCASGAHLQRPAVSPATQLRRQIDRGAAE